MKKKDITIGQTYRCKVSGSVVDVRITGVSPHGGWDGINVLTNRKVRIKTAQRLRAKTPPRPTKRKKIVSLAEYEAEGNAEAAARKGDIAKAVKAVKKGDLAKGVVVPTGAKPGKKTEFAKHLDRAVAAANQAPSAKKAAKATTKASTPKQRGTGQRGAAAGDTGGKKPMSCLTAAVQVLQERKAKDGPLSCPEMIQRMRANGYWQPRRGGKTPGATLYSAILREIQKKAKASRFVKAEPGKFTLVKGA